MCVEVENRIRCWNLSCVSGSTASTRLLVAFSVIVPVVQWVTAHAGDGSSIGTLTNPSGDRLSVPSPGGGARRSGPPPPRAVCQREMGVGAAGAGMGDGTEDVA